MTPAYAEHGIRIWQGDARESLRAVPAGSYNACVTSPPSYGEGMCPFSSVDSRAVLTNAIASPNGHPYAFAIGGKGLRNATPRGLRRPLIVDGKRQHEVAGEAAGDDAPILPVRQGQDTAILDGLRKRLCVFVSEQGGGFWACDHRHFSPLWIILFPPISELPHPRRKRVPEQDEQSNLSVLDAQEWQKHLTCFRSLAVCRRPRPKGSSILFTGRVLLSEIPAKTAVKQGGNDLGDLLQPNTFAVDGLCGIATNAHGVGRAANREETIRVHGSGQVSHRQGIYSIHRLDGILPMA